MKRKSKIAVNSGSNREYSKYSDLTEIMDRQYILMGILNVTPDSFYDGGKYDCVDVAVDKAEKMIGEGVNIIDIGGESTRPGAVEISVEEEISRVIPVIRKIREFTDIPISIDTRKSEVAYRAVSVGATWINDVSSGKFDSNMPNVVAELGCPVVLMHSRETPATMQKKPQYKNVIDEVCEELCTSIDLFEKASVKREKIIIDPGIGFAKRVEDNISILHNLKRIVSLGYPLLIGTSRKSFIEAITGSSADDRLAGTLASVAIAWKNGAKVFRVHDVKETKDFLDVYIALDKA